MSHGAYIAHTATSDLGGYGSWCGIGELRPGQVPAAVRNLVVHMDQVSGGPAHRSNEPSMRRVSDMLARLHDLDDAGITGLRPVERRLIGHCRTSSMLATAFYRHLGVAARPRCGFAAYYADGRDFYGDHWVVEVWDEPAARWRLVDTELDSATSAAHHISFDPADVPRDEFIPAGQAWLDCRAGSAQARMFGPYPDRTGWRQLADQLTRDAGCLSGQEAGPFDSWLPEQVTPELERVLDVLAAISIEPAVTAADLDDVRAHHRWLVPR
jgi:Transglutaminase-like superfamily